MKVGTDGVLVGAWAELPNGKCRVLDVGCGSGLISLMIAQRNTNAEIVGLDIDVDAVAEARFNVEASKYSSQISIINADFLQVADTISRFDLIVCNPPFFKEAQQSHDAQRAIARHDEALPIDLLIKLSSQILTPQGSLALIVPTNRNVDVEFAASLAGLIAIRRTDVVTAPIKPPKRTLWQLSKIAAPICREIIAIRTAEGLYSEKYIELVSDFYTNL